VSPPKATRVYPFKPRSKGGEPASASPARGAASMEVEYADEGEETQVPPKAEEADLCV
jgi:hypothetical protein